MERKDILNKKVQGMFLAKELYDITDFEEMKDTYAKNISKIWIEIAVVISNIKKSGLDDTELEIMETFKSTKYSDINQMISNVAKLKKFKYNIINLISI